MRNCTGDEGRPFEVGNQVLVSSHRKPLSSKAMVVQQRADEAQHATDDGLFHWWCALRVAVAFTFAVAASRHVLLIILALPWQS